MPTPLAALAPRVPRLRPKARVVGRLRRLGALALACAGWLSPLRAGAQDAGPAECVPPPAPLGPVEFFPAVGAGGVARDTTIRIRYTPGFFDVWRDPLSALFELRDDVGGLVPGSLERLGDTLVFRPAAPLRATTTYRGTAFGIDILRRDLRFSTGDAFDTEPPVLGGRLAARPRRVDARPCTGRLGYAIDVDVPIARDPDGADGDIEYLLFQTRGPQLDRPVLRARARNFSGSVVPMSFVLEPSEAVSPVCVAVVAVDGAGRTATTQGECLDPIDGAFFEPLCAAVPPVPAGRGAAGALAAAALGALLVAERARRAPHRRRHGRRRP
jgi:hypothetical protein